MLHTASIVISVILAAQPGGDSYSQERDPGRVEHCVVSQIEHVQLPAQEEGKLSRLDVKDGDVVREGDILGKIDDTDALVRKRAAQFELNVETEKATNDAMVRLQEKMIQVTLAEYNQSLEINRRSPGTISESELRIQRLRWEKAVLDKVSEEMNLKIAGLQQKVAEVKVEAADNELDRRTLRAPYDAVVVRLLRQQSEWVRAGDPVLYLIRMDRMRVEGFVNAEHVAPRDVYGAKVEITPDLKDEDELARPLEATISYVSPVVESNGDYRVWAEIDNPPGKGAYQWLLRPGVEAEMVIDLPAGAH